MQYLLFDGIGARHPGISRLTSAGRKPGFPSQFSVCGVVNDLQLVQGRFVESPGIATSGVSNLRGSGSGIMHHAEMPGPNTVKGKHRIEALFLWQRSIET